MTEGKNRFPASADGTLRVICVSPMGKDSGDGSRERPFATLGRAARAVRELSGPGQVRVELGEGEYFESGLEFTAEDGGGPERTVCWHGAGAGKTIVNGGLTLPRSDFEPLSPEIRGRLHGPAREHTLQLDLRRRGLTPADWGRLSPVGEYCTDGKYDDFQRDLNCELFCGGRRMTLARYPNAPEYLRLSAVEDVGDCWEFPEQNYRYDWPARRNHRPGAYIVDKETAARMEHWLQPGEAWIYGFFYHDWADSSSPVAKLEPEQRRLVPGHVAYFGARKDALYYFYNVLEELDEPGEWYLDRESGMLYFYPPENAEDERIELTITRKCLFGGENVRSLTLEDMSLRGSRNDAIRFSGSDITIRGVEIRGVLGNGIVLDGERNLVEGCEISRVGKSGIRLSGGCRESLRPGNSAALNNHVHHWAEIDKMYQGGIRLDGVGNRCAHNELHDCPHTAIFYYGNDHVIEYNYVHDAVLHSSDAGAIYSGQDWTAQGCVIRCNCLARIGRAPFTPDGIYFDDALSGQTAYGNVLIDVGKNGFLVGGGRENRVTGNLLCRCGTAIQYDARARDGALENGWAKASVVPYETGSMWVNLRKMPVRSPVWREKYPLLSRLHHDFSRPEDPDFGPNPSYAEVSGNVILEPGSETLKLAPSVSVFGKVGENPVFATAASAAERALPDDFPVEKMGIEGTRGAVAEWETLFGEDRR